LVLAALAASSAQAEAGANWKMNGANVTAGLLPSVVIKNKEVEGGEAQFATEIAKTAVAVGCIKADLQAAKLETSGKITAGAKIRFSECTTRLGGKVTPTCEPFTGTSKGVMFTKELKGLLVLHSGAGIIRLEPVTGESFLFAEFSEECSVGEGFPVIGKLTLNDSLLTTEAVSHSFFEGPLTELWVISKTKEHELIILGGLPLILSGTHSGLKWSGLPA
jgi:hypothetical protein